VQQAWQLSLFSKPGGKRSSTSESKCEQNGIHESFTSEPHQKSIFARQRCRNLRNLGAIDQGDKMKKQMITFTAILWAVGFLVLTPFARALVPPPEGGYPNLHTALGDKALFNSTGGMANTAIGWYSQWGNTTGMFNTSLGAVALLYPP
jgi:hypothetical protein